MLPGRIVEGWIGPSYPQYHFLSTLSIICDLSTYGIPIYCGSDELISYWLIWWVSKLVMISFCTSIDPKTSAWSSYHSPNHDVDASKWVIVHDYWHWTFVVQSIHETLNCCGMATSFINNHGWLRFVFCTMHAPMKSQNNN